MSENSREQAAPNQGDRFDSRDAINFISDGPGDTTIRPARPLLKKLAQAERERVARWEKLLEQEKNKEQTKDHEQEEKK